MEFLSVLSSFNREILACFNTCLYDLWVLRKLGMANFFCDEQYKIMISEVFSFLYLLFMVLLK